MRLLAPMTLGFGSRFLGILQVIGAILGRLLFRFATEKVSLELADFAAEKLEFLLHFVQSLDGSSMHALPIAGLLPSTPSMTCLLYRQPLLLEKSNGDSDREQGLVQRILAWFNFG